jgi:hypothetical protein
MRLRRPSHATVIAYAALFTALTGSAYAAIQLPRDSVGARELRANSVGRSEIRPGAVGSTEVANGSLRRIDFAAGQLPAGARGPVGERGERGERGLQGAPGAAGAPGTAKAWAHISDSSGPTNLVDESRSKGITDAMVSKGGTGTYCFDLSSIPNAHVGIASPNPVYNPENAAVNDRIALVQNLTNDTFGQGCPSTSDMVVVIHDISVEGPVDWFFHVAIF